MADQYCRRCERESETAWKCDECGKPFEASGSASGSRSAAGGAQG